jgi:hypothetical protein
MYETGMVTGRSRPSLEHTHDIGEGGVENVRACCGGMDPPEIPSLQ